MFTLKKFATIHHQKQLATESGRIKISNCQNFHSRHFAYINNLYDIELGHKSHDHCLIRNIKHSGIDRKVLLVDCCIAYTKIKPSKCKVVEIPHFSPKLIEYILG